MATGEQGALAQVTQEPGGQGARRV